MTQARAVALGLLFVVVGPWALLSLTGCKQQEALGLRVQINAEPVSLDPSLAEDGLSLGILYNVMDGLVGYDADGTFGNRLAASYRVSEDGKRYEFTLRPDALWSDGKKVQAGDFVAGFRRAMGPKMANKEAQVFYVIRGAKDYHEGHGSAEGLGVREEDGKVVFELERKAAYFLQLLTMPGALPLRKDVLDANAGKWPETAPCTGAYRIASHIPDQKLVLELTPSHRGPERVTLLMINDETTAVRLFEQGKLDILTRVPSLEIGRLRKSGVLRTNPFFAVYYIAFNVTKPPFDNRDWRRAVAGSIKKDEIVTALGSGEIPARSWIPRGIEGYYHYEDNSAVFADSVAKVHAAELRRPTEVQAAFDTSARNSLVMEKIQQDLAKGLGLRVTLDNLDWKSFIASMHADAPQIYRSGWMAPFRDPIMHLRVFVTGDPNNVSRFTNAEYDLLVAEIEELSPGPEREAKLFRAQKILLEEQAVVVPIYHYVQNHAVSARVKNFQVNPFGEIRFAGLDVTGD